MPVEQGGGKPPYADRTEALARFLLDELPEAERAQMEERIFTDPEFSEAADALEDELLRDYACGKLPAHQQRKLEAKYFASPALAERVEFARALALETQPGQSGRAAKPAWVWAAGIAAVLATGSAAALAVRVSHLQSSVAELQSRLQAKPASRLVIALSLSPGTRRGESPQPVAILPPDAAELELELETPTNAEYRATLTAVDSGQAVQVDAPARSAGGLLTVSIAPARLASADYLLRLDTASSRGEHETYAFRVLRK